MTRQRKKKKAANLEEALVEFAVYDRAITEAEMEALYRGGDPVAIPGCKRVYQKNSDGELACVYAKQEKGMKDTINSSHASGQEEGIRGTVTSSNASGMVGSKEEESKHTRTTKYLLDKRYGVHIYPSLSDVCIWAAEITVETHDENMRSIGGSLWGVIDRDHLMLSTLDISFRAYDPISNTAYKSSLLGVQLTSRVDGKDIFKYVARAFVHWKAIPIELLGPRLVEQGGE